jgi:hypothetical protein
VRSLTQVLMVRVEVPPAAVVKVNLLQPGVVQVPLVGVPRTLAA